MRFLGTATAGVQAGVIAGVSESSSDRPARPVTPSPADGQAVRELHRAAGARLAGQPAKGCRPSGEAGRPQMGRRGSEEQAEGSRWTDPDRRENQGV